MSIGTRESNPLLAGAILAAVLAAFTAGGAESDTRSGPAARTADRSLGQAERTERLVGRELRNRRNQRIGKIEDLVVDLESGRVWYAIVSPDRDPEAEGYLYALPPGVLTLSADKRHLVANVDDDKLAAAPRFKSNDWPDLSSRSYAAQVYRYYGKQPHFESERALHRTATRTNSPERIYHEP